MPPFFLANSMDWLQTFLPFQQLVSIVDLCLPVFWVIGLFVLVMGSVQEIPKHPADGIASVVVRGIVILAMMYWVTMPGDNSLMVQGEQLAKTATEEIIYQATQATGNTSVTVVPQHQIQVGTKEIQVPNPYAAGNNKASHEFPATVSQTVPIYQTVPALTWNLADASWIINKNSTNSSDLLYDFSAPFDQFELFIKNEEANTTPSQGEVDDATALGAVVGAAKGLTTGAKSGNFIGAILGLVGGGVIGGVGANTFATSNLPQEIVMTLITLVANVCMFIMQVMLDVQKLILIFDRLILAAMLALLAFQGAIRFVAMNLIVNVLCVLAWPFGWGFVFMGVMAGFSKLYTLNTSNADLGTLLVMFVSFLLIALWLIIGVLATPALLSRTITAGASFGAGLVGGAAGRAAQTGGKLAAAGATTAGAAGGGALGGLVGGTTGARIGANIGGSFGASVGGGANSLGSNLASSMFQGTGGQGGALPTQASSAAGMAALQGLSQMGQAQSGYGGQQAA